MPLVIVSGIPLSGKSAFANQLASFIVSKNIPGKSVEIVCDDDYGFDRSNCYSSSLLEKKARGNFLSAIERKITKDHIIIADGLNYIKGFRYQLYCIARAISTPHCVLYCVASETTTRRRNDELQRYPPQVVEELMMRFEEPHYSARWDNPLFTAATGNDLDMQAILDTLLGGIAKPPSMATLKNLSNNTELLVELDRVTQNVIENILAKIKQVGVPASILIGHMSLMIKKPVMGSDLQRLRRQFIHLNRLHQANAGQIEELFAEYLENNLK